LLSVLQEPDPKGTHVHLYTKTCVKPKSLEKIIIEYFKKRNWPITRRIDYVPVRPGLGSLHGIEPKGKPHFDLHWGYDSEIGLKGSEEGENGSNLLVWNRWYMNEFYNGFKFRKINSKAEKALKKYFDSEHWEKGLQIAVDPNTTHLHVNVNASVHPNEIEKYAVKSLKRRGWKLDYVCPNVYLVGGKYRAKLVFMGRKPENVFDIGWKFLPDVIIEPAMEPWIKDQPGYDHWPKALLDEVMDHPYYEFSSSEIKGILKAC
jgi:hypothetical protein